MRGSTLRLKGRTDLARLQSFIVFDGIVPPGETSEPVLYFSQCLSESDSHFAVNLAGVLLTFRKFCSHFTTASPFDYVATNTHEFAILELSDDIWMAVQRKLSTSPNRNLLHSMLQNCKSIYELFWPNPHRIGAELSGRSAAILRDAFAMIVNSITWADLAFIQLFDSFLQLVPSPPFAEELSRIVRTLQASARVPIAHVAVLHSRYVLCSTFPRDVARTLAMAMSMKLPYLFPKQLAKQEERLYWIIGLSRETPAVRIYAPPILIGGEMYPLIALRKLKLRILIALKPGSIVTPEELGKIPELLGPLQRHFKRARAETSRGKMKGPYIVVRNMAAERMLTISHDKMSYQMIPVAENAMFLAEWFATSTGRRATVAFPAAGNFVVYFREEGEQQVVVLYKVETGEISAAIRECKELEKPQNVASLQVIST